MPFVLVWSRDVDSAGYYATALGQIGFIAEPAPDPTQALRLIALANGRADALALVEDSALFDIERMVPPRGRSGVAIGEAFTRIIADVRSLEERLAFKGAVRVRTLPIVVALGLGRDRLDLGARRNWVTTCTLPGPRSAAVSYLGGQILDGIKQWRESLLSELEYVGYVVTIDEAGRYSVSQALARRRREGEILTDEATPGALRSHQFLVLADDLLAEFNPYVELKWLLQNYEAVASREGVKPETVFQRFFEQHPQLIYRSEFARHFSKPTLRDPAQPGRVIQPDFVLKPGAAPEFGSRWEVLDLKLPDEHLVVTRNFHPDFSAKVHHAIQQLRDYRQYFSRPDTREETVRAFGMQPVNPRAAILIGRRRAEDRDAIDHLHDPTLDVRLITYDDLLEFEESRLWMTGFLAGLFNG